MRGPWLGSAPSLGTLWLSDRKPTVGRDDLRVHRSFDSIEAAWERLAEREHAPPYLRPAWFRAWWEAFGRGSLAILAVEQRDGLAGVLPLGIHAGVARGLANYHTVEFGPLAEDPATAASLIEAATRMGRRRVELRFVDLEALTVARQAVTGPASRRSLTRVLERSPWIDLTAGWDDYRSSLGTKFLRNIERRRRRLSELGPVEVTVTDGTTELPRLLAEGFAVEGSGWKGAAGTAIDSHPRTETFYRDVSTWAAAHGWLRLAHLRVGPRVVAFDLALEYGGHHYLLKTGYDPEYARFGPGKLLRLQMIRRAFDHSLRVYDFLGDAVPWKLEWTTEVRERSLVQFFPPGLIGEIEHVAFAHGRPLAIKARDLRRTSVVPS
jgi:CelD/BcsL family acetyltransferase involved in cellulose biosynthesis